MAGIGIGINVDARQLKDARKEVAALGKDLDTIGAANPSAGGQQAALIRQLKDEIARMGQLSRSADARGGMMNPKQLREVHAVTKSVREGFATWTAEIDKAKAALKSLATEKERLYSELKNKSLGVDQRRGIYSRIAEVEQERQRAQQTVSGGGRMGDMANSAQRAQQGLGNVEIESKLNSKKIIGYGAALLGATSVMGFLMESMSRAGAIAQGRQGLGMLGAQRAGGAGYGFGPAAELQIAEEVAKRGGFQGSSSSRATTLSMQMSRAFAMDAGSSSSFVGSTAAMTGMNDQQVRQYIEAMRDFGKLGKHNIGARIEEYVNVNQRLMQVVASSTGGGKISAESATFMAGMQATLWGGGPSGQNADIMSKLNSTMASGGNTPGGQLFMWDALGGNNVQSGSLKELWEQKKRMKEGVSNPENVRGVLNKALSFGGLDTYIPQWTMASQFGLTEVQTDNMFNQLQKSGALNPDVLANQKKFAAAMQSRAYGDLTGDAAKGTSQHAQVQAGIEELQVKIGDALLSVANPIKQGLTDVVNDLNKGDFTAALKDFNRLATGGYAAGSSPEAVAQKREGIAANFRFEQASDVSRILSLATAPIYTEGRIDRDLERAMGKARKGDFADIGSMHGLITGDMNDPRVTPEQKSKFEATDKAIHALVDELTKLTNIMQTQQASH